MEGKLFRRSISILLMLLLGYAYGFSQGIVFGTIRDTARNPLQFVNIAIIQLGTGTTSDTSGFFQLEVPSGQPYVIRISSIGYETIELEIRLESGERKDLSQVLVPSASEIAEVRVLTQYDRSSTFFRLDKKDFVGIPSAAGQFEAVLKTLPGVASNNELSSQYSVRGGNFDENLVYVNDIEIYRPFLIRSGQQEGLSFINPDMVESVRFSAGGFDASFGDKMSSVLDITYREPSETAASASLSFLGGSFHFEGSGMGNRFTHISGIRYKSTQYLLNALDVTGDYKPSFLDFQTYLTYDVSDNFELSILGNIAQNNYRFIPQDRRTSFGTVQEAVQLYIVYDGQETDRFTTYLGAVTGEYRPNSELSLKFIGSAFSTLEDETFDIQGRYSLNELEKELGSENLGDSAVNIGIGRFLNHARNDLTAGVFTAEHKGFYTPGNAEWRWGLRARHETIDNTINEWELVDSAGYSIPYTGETVNLSYTNQAELNISSFRYSSYLQYQIALYPGNARLTLTGGVRANYWDFNKELLLSPRISAWLNPSWQRDFQFHFAGGIYYQPPFFKELRDPSGNINRDIMAQKSLHLVLGSDYNFIAWERPFKYVAEVYYKDMARLIPYKIDNVRIRYAGKNLARGYAVGLDMKVNGEFVPGVESWASLSIMQTKEDIINDIYLDDNNTPVEPGYYPRPTDQLVNFGLYFQDYVPNNPSYRVQLSLLYGSKLTSTNPFSDRYDQVFRMPSYRRVDIGFSKVFKDEFSVGSNSGFLKPFKSLWVGIEVFNLLDINNTISYLWVSTINNLSGEVNRYAVPNYLTSRRLNLKVSARF